MAETRIVHCDRCGGLIEPGLVRLVATTGTDNATIDLHAECYAALREWLAAGSKREGGGGGS